MAPHRLPDKFRVPQSSRTQDHPADSAFQVIFHGGHVPDAAPHLHMEAGIFHHVKDQLGIGRFPHFGAVQVHHVEPPGPLLLKAPGSGHRVLGHHFRSVIVPSEQAHAFSLMQVNRWQ